MNIYLEKKLFKDAFDSEDQNYRFIEHYWYHQDNLIKMDW